MLQIFSKQSLFERTVDKKYAVELLERSQTNKISLLVDNDVQSHVSK